MFSHVCLLLSAVQRHIIKNFAISAIPAQYLILLSVIFPVAWLSVSTEFFITLCLRVPNYLLHNGSIGLIYMLVEMPFLSFGNIGQCTKRVIICYENTGNTFKRYPYLLWNYHQTVDVFDTKTKVQRPKERRRLIPWYIYDSVVEIIHWLGSMRSVRYMSMIKYPNFSLR